MFWDSKRPLTKKLLTRIDLNRLAFNRAKVLSAASHDAELLDVPFDQARAGDFVAGFNQIREPGGTLF